MASISTTPVVPVDSTTPPDQVVVVDPKGRRTEFSRHGRICIPWLIAGIVIGVVFMLVWNQKKSQ